MLQKGRQMWSWMSLLLYSVNFTFHNLLNLSFAELPVTKRHTFQSFSNILAKCISGIYYCWLLQTTKYATINFHLGGIILFIIICSSSPSFWCWCFRGWQAGVTGTWTDVGTGVLMILIALFLL